MTDQRPISRREMIRGRFLRKLLDAAADRASSVFDGNHGGGSTAGRAESTGDHIRSSMIMRYPKSADDVHCASPAQTTGSNVAARFRRSVPVMRPPGAVDEPTFLGECTRCAECITACPHDAIVLAPARFREASGTPMIDPDHQPCMMCADFPCISACEPKVLSREIAVMMGAARITEQTCLAHQGTTCTVCSEHCPVEGAIEVVAGKPRVIEDTCTGCGVCRFVCPAPENAVLLMPTFARPPRPALMGDDDE